VEEVSSVVRVVDFLSIVKKLIPGRYHTSTGNPMSPHHFEKFVEEVKKKVPELAEKEDWEVESTVLEALDWAMHTICVKKREWGHATEAGFYVGMGLYKCEHPDTGKFYIVHFEEEIPDAGEAHVSFKLTRDWREAQKSFSEERKYWEEKIRE
jgi:hypothetical protein